MFKMIPTPAPCPLICLCHRKRFTLGRGLQTRVSTSGPFTDKPKLNAREYTTNRQKDPTRCFTFTN